jgi:hypothetical protein
MYILYNRDAGKRENLYSGIWFNSVSEIAHGGNVNYQCENLVGEYKEF